MTVPETRAAPVGERGREVGGSRALQHRGRDSTSPTRRSPTSRPRGSSSTRPARSSSTTRTGRPRRLAARARGRESLPLVSAGGKRYTFRIRDGFRFSPPSNERVTAADVQVLDRAQPEPEAEAGRGRSAFIGDIVGLQAYRAGRAQHISGVVARGNTPEIELTRAAPDFPARSRCRSSAPCRSARRSIPAGSARSLPRGPTTCLVHAEAADRSQTQPELPRAASAPARSDRLHARHRQSADRRPDRGWGGRLRRRTAFRPRRVARLAARYGAGSAGGAGGERSATSPSRSWASPSSRSTRAARSSRTSTCARRSTTRSTGRRWRGSSSVPSPAWRANRPISSARGSPASKTSASIRSHGPDVATAKRLAAGRGGRAVLYTCNTARARSRLRS